MGQTQENNADGNQTFYASNGSCTFLAGQKNGPAQSCSGQCTNGYMTNGVTSADCGGGSPSLFFYNGDDGALDPNGNYSGGGGSGFDCSTNPASPYCTANCDMYDPSCAPSTYVCNPDSLFTDPDADPGACGGAVVSCCDLSQNFHELWLNSRTNLPSRQADWSYFYFNTGHFWSRLSCHLDGLTQDAFMDQVAAALKQAGALNNRYYPISWNRYNVPITLPSGATVIVTVTVFTGIVFQGDIEVYSAFIQGLPDC